MFCRLACGWEKDVSTGGQITSLLGRWNVGDEEAFKSLVSLVYAELHRLAHNRLGRENSNLTVNTTALVHETYVRLAEHPPHEVRDRNHFFAVALSQLDERQSRIVELRFFAGLSIEDTAEVLGTSPATVKRDWMTARAWLYNAMSRQPKCDTKIDTHGA
jgi:DNA-directed RNA polymerase specialized sigma24 family protein